MGLATSIIGAIAGEKAANTQADATQRAADTATGEQRRQFDLSRADSAPWRAAGASALDKLSRLYGLSTSTATPSTDMGASGWTYNPETGAMDQNRVMDAPGPSSSTPNMSVFTESPDYQFNLAEGQKAIERSAAARGGLLSGAAVKAGQRYASGLASQQYGDFYNRLAAIAGLGSSVNQQSAVLGANAANQIGNYQINAGNIIGNARASAYKDIAANQANESANASQIAGYFLGKH